MLIWITNKQFHRRLCYIGSVKDDVVDLFDLAINLLEDLCEIVPQKVAERYHIQDTSLRGQDLIDSVCRGRGWLMKGAEYDYDRCCSVVLDEFRENSWRSSASDRADLTV